MTTTRFQPGEVAAGAPVPPITERHLRADARRNRERILAAAEAAFRELGTAVQMDDVARRAGVGVGTLYRHFPTKEALVEELATLRVTGCIAQAETAIAMADAWAAVECFVYSNAEQMASDAGLRDSLAAVGRDQMMCRLERGRLEERLGIVLDRARAAGTLSADVTVHDVQSLMTGLSAAIAGGGDWQRLARIVLAGLRAPQGSSGPSFAAPVGSVR